MHGPGIRRGSGGIWIVVLRLVDSPLRHMIVQSLMGFSAQRPISTLSHLPRSTVRHASR